MGPRLLQLKHRQPRLLRLGGLPQRRTVALARGTALPGAAAMQALGALGRTLVLCKTPTRVGLQLSAPMSIRGSIPYPS